MFFKKMLLSVLCMLFALCLVTLLFFAFEAFGASLLVFLLMLPSPLLYLLIEKHYPARVAMKHIAYHVYWLIWILVFVFTYFTAVELPEISGIGMIFFATAAGGGYLPLCFYAKSNIPSNIH